MLEGKAPMDHTAIAVSMNKEGSPIIQERIVYRDGENKENSTQLEEELRNKEN